MSKLVNQSVPGTFVRMALPMLAGTFAINMYNLTNAWFVSRLGTEVLAAISFTFPVVMFLMFATRGLGSGAMTLVAHAIGGTDHRKAATLTTHALILAILFAAGMSLLGMLTIIPLFSRLGASGEVLDLTARYMKLWYLGAIVMVLQMVTSDIIISTGNTKTVSFLMVSSTALNVLLLRRLHFRDVRHAQDGYRRCRPGDHSLPGGSLGGCFLHLGQEDGADQYRHPNPGIARSFMAQNSGAQHPRHAGHDPDANIGRCHHQAGR